MRLRNIRVEKTPELMIIPMIDIIFFLLVFFMISSMYMVEQNTIPVNLPQAANAKQDLPKSINVTVTKTGDILLEKDRITVDLIKKQVASLIKAEKNQIIILRADRDVDYGKVVNVLDELKAAGAKRISIATEHK